MNFRLHDVFTDHMILQRHAVVKIAGWTDPGITVFASFHGKTSEGSSENDGFFSLALGPFEALSTGEVLEAGVVDQGKRMPLTSLQDVVVGEVWFGCGQSNMEMGIKMSENGILDASKADHPGIRLFLLPKTSGALPTETLDGEWKVCTPKDLVEGGWEGFSAVGYYFSVKLHQELNIPVGFIQSAFGGAWIHPFIRPDLLNDYESLRPFYREWAEAQAEYGKNPDAPHPLSSFTEYNTHKAGSLYNVMVHPFRNFPVKGILWYQGESNIGDGPIYLEKLEALCRSFRSVFGNQDLWFFIAQIAPWGGYEDPDVLPALWQAQYDASAKLQRSGLVVTVDVGMIEDIHPIKKKPVGDRFANLALQKVYGVDSPWNYPSPVSARRTPGKILLKFEDDVKLKSRDDKALRWFEVEDTAGRIALTTASIEGEEIAVDYDDSFIPKYVLYAWNTMADDVNLYSLQDLPVRPFKIAVT